MEGQGSGVILDQMTRSGDELVAMLRRNREEIEAAAESIRRTEWRKERAREQIRLELERRGITVSRP